MACQNVAWISSNTDWFAGQGAIDQHSAIVAESLIDLCPCLPHHRINGILDALRSNDPSDLLVNWSFCGHNDGVGPQLLQFSHRCAATDDIDCADAIMFRQLDDHASQFGPGC